MARAQRLFFCYRCGGQLKKVIRGTAERLQCTQCGTVSYENPIVGVAGIMLSDKGEILLVRRAPGIDYAGLWCIPCGYVEYDEDVRDAVVREVKEETGFDIVPGEVFAVHSNFHNPRQHTVGIWFLATLTGGSPQAGDDADELGWFSLDDIPPLAFPTDELVLDKLRKNENGKQVLK